MMSNEAYMNLHEGMMLIFKAMHAEELRRNPSVVKKLHAVIVMARKVRSSEEIEEVRI